MFNEFYNTVITCGCEKINIKYENDVLFNTQNRYAINKLILKTSISSTSQRFTAAMHNTERYYNSKIQKKNPLEYYLLSLAMLILETGLM